MEQLFRTTDLEVRLSLNMNVLDAAGTPRVMSLAEVLESYLAHRMEVLVRRSRHRLAKVEDRLEVLDGYLKAFLDLDEVIRIIREEDEPKAALMARFELSDRQAEAILNLRLRNLRKLEEMELKAERARLAEERAGLQALLADEGKRRARLKEEFLAARKQFGSGALGKRRTELAEAPVIAAELLEEPVERYPVTVVCSKLGWIRVVRGLVENAAEIKYKEGDRERFILRAQSSDRLAVIAANGRVYTLAIDKLPSGRGHGEPISLSLDLEKGAEILDLRVCRPDGRLVFATRKGFGFVAEEKEIEAQTRAGRQVVNLGEGDTLLAAVPVEGDHLAVSGTNRKLLVFPLAELPVQARGKGVMLMKLKDAELADLKTLDPAQGLGWAANGKEKRVADLTPWRGSRASAGRMAPSGFPKNHRFG
jgi:topoisomerase-4 subunit A